MFVRFFRKSQPGLDHVQWRCQTSRDATFSQNGARIKQETSGESWDILARTYQQSRRKWPLDMDCISGPLSSRQTRASDAPRAGTGSWRTVFHAARSSNMTGRILSSPGKFKFSSGTPLTLSFDLGTSLPTSRYKVSLKTINVVK